MKVCIVSPHLPPMPYPCGAADFVSQLAQNLQAAGNEVTVLTGNSQAKSHPSYKVHIISGTWDLLHLLRVTRWLRSQSFDLIDLQYEASMYGRASAPMLFPQLLFGSGVPLILTLHSHDLPKVGGRAWRPIQILSYSGVIFYSKQFYDNMAQRFPKRTNRFLLQGFPSNIGRTVHPSVQPLIQKIKSGYFEKPFLLSYFGHINANRGIEELLGALVELRKSDLKPHLILISRFEPQNDPYQKNLLEMVRSLKLEDQVSFTGRLDDVEVSRFLTATDACVFPFPDGASFKNGSLAAAIEHGIPTITTLSDLTEGELKDSGGISFYKFGDQRELVASLKRIMEDPSWREQLRARANQLRDLLSWKNYIHKRTEFYGATRHAVSS